jgi:hypothetical protein
MLVAGAIVLVAWALFLWGFRSEPSATGRSRLVLIAWAVYSGLAALLGTAAAVGVLRGARWSRTTGALAAAAMTLSCVGAIAGVPALLGIYSSRGAARP